MIEALIGVAATLGVALIGVVWRLGGSASSSKERHDAQDARITATEKRLESRIAAIEKRLESVEADTRAHSTASAVAASERAAIKEAVFAIKDQINALGEKIDRALKGN